MFYCFILPTWNKVFLLLLFLLLLYYILKWLDQLELIYTCQKYGRR